MGLISYFSNVISFVSHLDKTNDSSEYVFPVSSLEDMEISVRSNTEDRNVVNLGSNE